MLPLKRRTPGQTWGAFAVLQCAFGDLLRTLIGRRMEIRMDQDGDVGDDDEEDWDVDGEDDIFNTHIAIWSLDFDAVTMME